MIWDVKISVGSGLGRGNSLSVAGFEYTTAVKEDSGVSNQGYACFSYHSCWFMVRLGCNSLQLIGLRSVESVDEINTGRTLLLHTLYRFLQHHHSFDGRGHTIGRLPS